MHSTALSHTVRLPFHSYSRFLLVKLERCVKTLPPFLTALAHNPLQPQTVFSCCFAVETACIECRSALAASVTLEWNDQAPGAVELKHLFLRYRTEIFPGFLQQIVTALTGHSLQSLRNSSTPFIDLPHMVFCTLVNCAGIMRMGNSTWYHRHSVSLGLIQAVSRFAQSPVWTIPLTNEVLDTLVESFAHIMSSMSVSLVTGGPAAPASLWTEVFSMAGSAISSALLRTGCTLTSNPTASLALLVTTAPHFQAQAALKEATVSIAKLAVLVASREGVLRPEKLIVVQQMMQMMCRMDLYSIAAAPLMSVSLMDFTVALNTFWDRHPTHSCQALLLLQRQQMQNPLDTDTLQAKEYTLHQCMRRAGGWMLGRLQNRDITHQFQDMMQLVGVIMYDNEGLTLTEELKALREWRHTPAFLNVVEALLRGGPATQRQDILMAFVSNVYSVLRTIVERDVTAGAAHSLLRTVHKVLLPYLKPADSSRSGVIVSIPTLLVSNLYHIQATLQPKVDTCPESFRMHRVALATLQPLMLDQQRKGFVMQPPLPAHLPSPDTTTTQKWGAIVTDFSRKFRGRLLYGCSYVGCTELRGALDSLLPTQLCPGCRRLRYCCRPCQGKDWLAWHSEVCGKGEWSLSAEEAQVGWNETV